MISCSKYELYVGCNQLDFHENVTHHSISGIHDQTDLVEYDPVGIGFVL